MPSPRTAAPATRLGTTIALLSALALTGLSLGSLRASIVALPNLQLDAPVVPAMDATGPALSPPGRVLLVVIDGLRADVAAELPFLVALGQRGARVDLWAEMPTCSSAEYVAMLTGVPPRDSGVRTNARLLRTPLDNIPRRLRADGRRAVQIGDQVDWWARLFGNDLHATAVVPPEALVGETARRMADADLAVVHICGVDDEGHRVGARSPAYRAAARDADAKTRTLAQAWGWPAATVVVLADHGHVLAGGHGGDEPDVRQSWLVASGPGIRTGVRVSGAHMIDIAPTLAALLGIAAPGTAQGRTLTEALVLPEQARTAIAASDRDRITRSRAAAETRRHRLLDADRPKRAARLAGLVAAVALGILVLRRAGRPAWLGLAAGTATLILTVAAFGARHGRLSLSADRSAERLAYAVGVLAVAASVLPFAPAFVAILRGRLKSMGACAFAVGAVIGGAPIAAFAFVTIGAFQPRLACEPAWLVALPLCAYVAFAPPVLAAALVTAAAGIRDLLARRRA